jgi:predicted aconitase
MNLGYRFFVVADDNSIIQISQRSFNDFYLKHRPSLQRFSGSVINVATVIYTLENRKPEQIVRIDYMRVKVDSDGALDQAQIDDTFRLVANRVGKFLGEGPPVQRFGQSSQRDREIRRTALVSTSSAIARPCAQADTPNAFWRQACRLTNKDRSCEATI